MTRPVLLAARGLGVVAHPASIDAGGRHLDRPARPRRPLSRHPLVRSGARRARRGAGHGGGERALRSRDRDFRSSASTGTPRARSPPRPRSWTGLDAIVYDLQDVGTRYYTFIYTLSYVMAAAGEAGIPVVVLDRPNPIGGIAVEGPVLEPRLGVVRGTLPASRPARVDDRRARAISSATRSGSAATFASCRSVGVDARHALRGHRPPVGLAVAQHADARDRARVSGRMPGRGDEPLGRARHDAAVRARGRSVPGGCRRSREALAQAGDADGLDGVVFREAWFRPTFQKHAGRQLRAAFRSTSRTATRPGRSRRTSC